MIEINIRGLPEIRRMLNDLAENQLPFAISSALNSTAFALQKRSWEQLKSVFDRPTPLIQGATRVEKATKQLLTAKVLIDPKREVILRTHETGGRRGDQQMERYLIGKGWLPAGYRAIPTDKLPLNSYGNPKPSEVKKIIQALPVISGVRTDRRRCFVIPPGAASHLSPGVYRVLSKSKGQAIMKLYHFATTAQYRARLGWLPTMETEALRLLPERMRAAVQRAIETAR